MIILDREQIEQRIDLDRVAPAIEQAYRATSDGTVNLPPVGHIEFPHNGGDCHIKFGHRTGDDVFVIKVATGFPANGAAGAPVGNGVSLVLSATSGEVVAVLHDQMLMTDVRTAVGSALASRTLARGDSTRLLIVGTGAQANHQIAAHRALFHRSLDVAIWGRSADKAQAIAATNHDVHRADELGKACRWADIIVTATAAREPIIDNGWIEPGTHITAVGADAPGKHELDLGLLHRADRLVADKLEQCLDHGEFSALDHASDIVEFGSVLNGAAPGRNSDKQITVADLTGIAAQDIAIAQAVLADETQR